LCTCPVADCNPLAASGMQPGRSPASRPAQAQSAAPLPACQVLLGFTLIATLATILGNLLADVAYAVLDPRVRYD
jgi:hypothetical protein